MTMANFPGHITTSATLGCVYGVAGSLYWQLDWGPVFLGAGLTTLGGMLPDLDSDSGVPVRELFSITGAATPVLLLPHLRAMGLGTDRTLVLLAASYLLVRFGLAEVFRRMTVHRGMFHSLPAMCIAGLIVFLLYRPTGASGPAADFLRGYMALGVMIGFFSHLVLDELFAVDLMGLVPKLNQFAGSACKLTSASLPATLLTYAILVALAWAAWVSL